MKILVVEDDKKLGGFVRKGLEARGFVVDFTDNGDDGYSLATTRPYDALVLDIMLPGRDGLSPETPAPLAGRCRPPATQLRAGQPDSHVGEHH